MVKKLKQMADKKAAGPRLFDSAMAAQVKDSAQQIWLAGMGAFARAQAEGTKVFETLVKEGTSLQKKTQSDVEEKIGAVTGKMTSMASDVQARAGQHWDKLEGIFEERTAKALKKLGVPTAKDVQTLVARVDALSAQVAGRAKTAAKSAAKTATRKRAPAKTAAKRAPRKTAA
jgi:poly(hydroxyalkanoate) granule-associated protein